MRPRNMVLVLGALALSFWVAITPTVHAMIRTIEEAPQQQVVQSRHQLRDNRGLTWQVILFARQEQLQLRLVGFPEQYHFRHPDPLTLITPSGNTLLAADDFPKAETVANVGQFDLQPLAHELPPDKPLLLRPPLQEEGIEIAVPAPVSLEWHVVIDSLPT
ncbi:DUF3122 domain-containing protein [Thermosynechococcaceae cyanobacterium Okahandja]